MNFLSAEKRKHHLTVVFAVLLCLPFFFWVEAPNSRSYNSVSLYIALMTGFIGTIVLMAQFFLGTRTITGLLYRDIPWTLRLHKKLGTYGTLLIFAHPVFMLYPYAQNFWYIFQPKLSSSFETSVTWGRLAIYVLIIIYVTSALLRGRIKYRPWKYTHMLGYVVLPLVFVHSPPIGRSLTNHEGLLLYWYLLAFVYLIMVALRLRFVFGYGKSEFSIISTVPLTDETYLMRLQSFGWKGFNRLHPGQYIYIQRGFVSEDHPFSVVDYDEGRGELLVAFKVYGSFTRKLADMKPDRKVLIDGPYGIFTHEAELFERPRVFIAGGIGITPFVRRILRAPNGTEQYLFFCNRTSVSGAFRTQLKQKLGAGHYIDVLSNDAVQPRPGMEHGRFSAEIIKKYIPDLSDKDYYLCGPAGMMHLASDVLRAEGVPPGNIHMEEFGF